MEPITERQISDVLHRFYTRVRADDQLAPVFAVVEDWDEHLLRLGEFWSSVMLTSGRYKGNPVSMHAIHAHRIRPEMFTRWLELWHATTDELLLPPVAATMQVKAARIASRLSAAVLGARPAATAPAPPSAAPRPYRVTAQFSERTIPAALLADHRLRPGTWGVLRVASGAVCYRADAAATGLVLDPDTPAVIPPDTPHHLELIGPVALVIEFYDRKPDLHL